MNPLANIGPILLSSFLFYVANGLLSLYLPLHLNDLSMSSIKIGLVMSCFAVGIFIASFSSGKLIQRSSHIRVFAAAGGIGCLVTLYYSLDYHLFVWALLRILTGYAVTAASIVLESWAQDVASPENRSFIVAVFMIVYFLSSAFSQLIPGFGFSIDLFILIGMLYVLSVIPLSLSKLTGPEFNSIEFIGFKELWKVSPIGVVGTFTSAMTYMSLTSLGSLFANGIGFSLQEISYFMFSIIIGAFIMQYPVGKMSDKYDRRIILLMTLIFSSILNLIVISYLTLYPNVSHHSNLFLILIFASLVGGTTSLVYPLSMAITFDWIDKKKMVNAMALCYMIFGIGGIIGPLASSYFIEEMGGKGLLLFILVIECSLMLYVMYRIKMRKSMPVEDQETFVPFSPSESVILASMEYDDSHYTYTSEDEESDTSDPEPKG
mgnify:CR=1 FL=1